MTPQEVLDTIRLDDYKESQILMDQSRQLSAYMVFLCLSVAVIFTAYFLYKTIKKTIRIRKDSINRNDGTMDIKYERYGK